MTEICVKYLRDDNPEAEWINSTSVVIRRNEWEDAIKFVILHHNYDLFVDL